MTQTERRSFLIRELLNEESSYKGMHIPADEEKQKELLRGLMNVRPAAEVSDEFTAVQDAYLKEETARKGITDADTLDEIETGICLWQGDITALKCDAIVNAANSGMTGCYLPNHSCIDNCIHTFAGTGMRLACSKMMQRQGHEEPVGRAKITSGFNLPCKYVLHTVGPRVSGKNGEQQVTDEERKQLAACYSSCLALAEQNDIRTLAFCCISTGVFGFPHDKAAEIAIAEARKYIDHGGKIRIIFNVHSSRDYDIYKKLLGRK